MVIYNNVKILDTDLERVHFTKHGLHLNSSRKECIAQRLATMVRRFFNKERISPVCLQWKDDTKIFSQDRTKNSYVPNCNEVTVLQSLPPNIQKVTNKNEDKITHPQIAKRQKKSNAARPGFFMDNIRSALTVSQSLKDNKPVNLTNTLNFYNETDCVMNFNEYEIRLLHHNVQSLNNKLLDIAVMLTIENLNVNILCFTEHWLLEAQMKVINIYYFRLVSNFSRNHSTSGGSCIFIRNNIETKKLSTLRQGSSTHGPWATDGPRSSLPWPAGHFEKITTNAMK
jgi:hypothetical protein